MQIKINLQSKVPIYIQIIDQIKHMLAVGELEPGDQLPTTRQLAADLRVNFNTIARAYRMLDEEGLISTQHGRGTYILSTSEENGEQLRKTDIEWLTKSYIEEGTKLGYSVNEIKQIFENQIRQWAQARPENVNNEMKRGHK